jgi:hypothetical protein
MSGKPNLKLVPKMDAEDALVTIRRFGGRPDVHSKLTSSLEVSNPL